MRRAATADFQRGRAASPELSMKASITAPSPGVSMSANS